MESNQSFSYFEIYPCSLKIKWKKEGGQKYKCELDVYLATSGVICLKLHQDRKLFVIYSARTHLFYDDT